MKLDLLPSKNSLEMHVHNKKKTQGFVFVNIYIFFNYNIQQISKFDTYVIHGNELCEV